MPFHLSYELLKKPPPLSFEETGRLLNETELAIIRTQIRRNTLVIDEYIKKIHLFVNQEKYPPGEPFIGNLRAQMSLLMDENDTFRKVLWNHYQAESHRISFLAEDGGSFSSNVRETA